MITSIRLRNFKAFKDTGHLEIAPLTVLTGPNSSGKSALIRAMMALRQTIESRDLSAAFVPTGDYVDLGPFSEFVFMHDVKTSVHLDVVCKLPASRAPIVGMPVTMDVDERTITINLELAYIVSSDRTYLSSSTIHSDAGDIHVNKVSKRGNALGKSYKTMVTGPENLSVELADISSARFHATPPFDLPSTGTKFQQDRTREQFMGTAFSRDVEDSVLRELSSFCYVGPLRDRPRRFYISTGEAPREVGSSGELGPAVLWSASEIRQLDLEDRLSAWCSRMGLAFEIHLATIMGSYFEIHAVDSHTRQHVNLPDVGFGTSQILPILIQGLIANSGTTLLLEQPEIHLHPKVQADLADFLIEVSQSGVGVIVETHSEHIITRIQRRIAEEVLSPDGLALYFLTPTDEGSHFNRISLDSFGQINHPPDGFFEEGFEETFALMTAVGARKAHPGQPTLID